jgi:serine/threonine protein kinase
MIKFFNPDTTPIKFMTIYGEAKVANYLEAPKSDNSFGQELFFSSSSYLFLKICKNKNVGRNPVQSTSELPRSDGKECYRSEIEVMATIKKGIDNVSCAGSDRIVLFNDVVSDADNVYVVLPFKKGLDANSKLNNYNLQLKSMSLGLKTTKSDYVCKVLLKNVSTAMCFLHSLGISHNDIKLENIVSAAPLDAPILDWVNNLAIVDFGQARRHCIDSSNSIVYPLPWLGIPGTPNYYCPETLNSAPYDGFKVDVFQLAMTIVYFQSSKLYEKFRKNFDEYKEFLARLKAFGPQQFVALFGFSDPVLNTLMVRMLDPDPKKRISMKEVREQSAL